MHTGAYPGVSPSSPVFRQFKPCHLVCRFSVGFCLLGKHSCRSGVFYLSVQLCSHPPKTSCLYALPWQSYNNSPALPRPLQVTELVQIDATVSVTAAKPPVWFLYTHCLHLQVVSHWLLTAWPVMPPSVLVYALPS